MAGARLDYSVTLPVEIWESLCDSSYYYFNPTGLSPRDYRALSETCRLFRHIFQKYLFYHLVYRANLGVWNTTNESTRRQNFLKQTTRFESRVKWLVANPHHSTILRELYFFGINRRWTTDFMAEGTAYFSVLSVLKHSIAHFSSLQVIYLVALDIEEHLLKSLSGLRLLKKADFAESTFTCRSINTLLNLEELCIRYGGTKSTPEVPLEVFSNKRLTVLTLNSFRDASPCLSHLTRQGESENLRELSIDLNADTIPVLLQFLATCRRLESLQISDITENVCDIYPNSTFPASALPRLCAYVGPGILASIVVPNRPVRSVAVIWDDWKNGSWEQKGVPILHEVSRSSRPMYILSLPLLSPRPDIFVRITERFPDLVVLNIFLDDCSPPVDEDTRSLDQIAAIELDKDGVPTSSPTLLKGLVERLCLKKLPLPPLIESLTILDNAREIADEPARTCISSLEQHRALVGLSKHYRQLSAVCFGKRPIYWNRSRDGKWNPGNQAIRSGST